MNAGLRKAMTAYYNEFDSGAAAWLRELIADGQIAPGIVDERSIEDVRPDELLGYTQCHFFAGIGGWSLALRQAGWPDDKPVWTGSCPCQPFSAAGKGAGFDDERHLWPSFQWLIQQCRPTAVFGEQVASKATGHWFDLVQADMEAMGYAFGLAAFPAASIGTPGSESQFLLEARSGVLRIANACPDVWLRQQLCDFADDLMSIGDGGDHIRDRAYWVGHAISPGLEGYTGHGNGESGRQESGGSTAEAGGAVRLADSDSNGRSAGSEAAQATGHRNSTGAEGGNDRPEPAGPTNGQWGAADWLLCRDGKWRPVEPGTFPLVDGIPRGVVPSGDIVFPTAEARTVRLKCYGNAIVPAQAAEFVRAAGIQDEKWRPAPT